MAYNVIITQQADRDLDQILAYLTQQLFSAQAAAALVAQYTDVLEKLEQFPDLLRQSAMLVKAEKNIGSF